MGGGGGGYLQWATIQHSGHFCKTVPVAPYINEIPNNKIPEEKQMTGSFHGGF